MSNKESIETQKFLSFDSSDLFALQFIQEIDFRKKAFKNQIILKTKKTSIINGLRISMKF